MNELYAEDQKYILNVYNRMDVNIVKGEGSYLIDDKGQKYLDMFSGIAVNNLGHNHESIKVAIMKQMNEYLHLSNHFVVPSVVKLAKLLVENSFASKVFFSNSGTEAIEAAIKLVRKYGGAINEKKVEIITCLNSFHGRTTGGITLTGQDKYKNMFGPLIPHVKHIPFNDVFSLRDIVSHDTCAVFLEVIQGEGGVLEVSQAFMEELVRLSKEYCFLVVIDEIQTGLGRLGDVFGYEKYNIVPDIVLVAKSLGGGLPIGAMLVHENLVNVFNYGEHGSTFGGNPLAAAVGEASLKTVIDKDFKQSVKVKGNYLIGKLRDLKSKYSNIILDVRGRGLMIGIDVGNHANTIKQKGMDAHLLLNVTSQTVIRLLPALNISYNEINEFLNKFEIILNELEYSYEYK